MTPVFTIRDGAGASGAFGLLEKAKEAAIHNVKLRGYSTSIYEDGEFVASVQPRFPDFVGERYEIVYARAAVAKAEPR